MEPEVELVNRIVAGDVGAAEELAVQMIRQHVDARIDDMKADVLKTAFSGTKEE